MGGGGALAVDALARTIAPRVSSLSVGARGSGHRRVPPVGLGGIGNGADVLNGLLDVLRPPQDADVQLRVYLLAKLVYRGCYGCQNLKVDVSECVCT